MNERNAGSARSVAIEPSIASSAQEVRIPKFLNLMLSSLVLMYSAARFLQLSGRVPILAVIVLHVLAPLVFTLLHGAVGYRIRGIVIFVVWFLLVGNIFENVSVITGFPFGHYYFTELMGPKLFHVPIFLGLAYVGMAYLSWTLASLILGKGQVSLLGFNVVLIPAMASLIMVAWDLSQDPAWSTVLHLWVWPRGGAYFGVPLSNFLGWYLTVYVIYQSFALYLRRDPPPTKTLPPFYWRLAVLFYGISAAGNLLLMIPRSGFVVVTDPTGAPWRVRDITFAGALVSILIMGSFALVAWLRVPWRDGPRPATHGKDNLLRSAQESGNLS